MIKYLNSSHFTERLLDMIILHETGLQQTIIITAALLDCSVVESLGSSMVVLVATADTGEGTAKNQFDRLNATDTTIAGTIVGTAVKEAMAETIAECFSLLDILKTHSSGIELDAAVGMTESNSNVADPEPTFKASNYLRCFHLVELSWI
jgi:hypothetical protein